MVTMSMKMRMISTWMKMITTMMKEIKKNTLNQTMEIITKIWLYLQDCKDISLNKFRFNEEGNLKKQNDSNIERVVQKGDYLYYITKDGKDKPLESHCKLT